MRLLILGAVLFFTIPSVNAQNTISGYVVSMETAKPIPNATVFLNNKYGLQLEELLKATSDSTGFYEITGIAAGTYILNAWTTYRVVDQQYAMLLQSDRIEVDRSRTVDLVFSEIDFKYSLHFRHHPLEAFSKPKRNSDLVARMAIQSQLFIDSQKEPIGASYIENITEVTKQ